MKRVLFIVGLFSTVTYLFSQSANFITATNKKDYFEKNILSLDPIEGIYDVEIIKEGRNAFQAFPNTSENTEMTIYKTGNNLFGIIGNDVHSIEKIGETNAYNYKIDWKDISFVDNKRIFLNNGVQFQMSFSVPIEQMKYDMGRNYQNGFVVSFTYNFIKKFPTNSMYIDAINNKRKEQNELDVVNDWSGTCFAIDKDLCVTNYHVVEGADNMNIVGINGDFGTEYHVKLIASDKNNDIALIKIIDGKFKGFTNLPYKINTNTSEVGEEVFVLGYPLTTTMGDEIKLTTGIISSKTGFQGDIALYQISAPIQPGNSGGPLFDNQGNIIGIVSAKHTGTENVGYAIKTTYLKTLTESANQLITLPFNNQVSSFNLINKVKTVKKFVFLLKCNKNESQNIHFDNSKVQNSNNDPIKKSNIILKNDIDSMSYCLGLNVGSDFSKNIKSIPGNKVNLNILIKGFSTSIKDEKGIISNDFAKDYFKKYIDKVNSGYKPNQFNSGGTSTLISDVDSMSYCLGLNVGTDFSKNLKGIPGGKVNVDILTQAFSSSLKNEVSLIDTTYAKEYFKKYIEKAQAKDVVSLKESGENFLKLNKGKNGVITTASGLQYQVISSKNGIKPLATDTVTVHYQGFLINGKKFDSSIDRGEPITFPLNQVISGWVEGIQLMSVGSKFKFFIPYSLGYGENGASSTIPPYATLIFEVELLGVKHR